MVLQIRDPTVASPERLTNDKEVAAFSPQSASLLRLHSLFKYPPAYIPLTGERGSFSLLDIITEDAKAFYDLHPKERQVRVLLCHG